ncbi:inositol monophosphatase family protein [Caldisericum exile]|uniref:Inositol-1-monophosphatase n=1 Tax=Caldisericum exile (strain DSM 21853 / NBRC 104410 / AZM16c01) TaxID=511051 RepID=A0A7U6GDV1_CALEA|nr:inositol monophosphatase family protein [Caldisericum exile]BAL80549.1 inositol-1-monophosphatase [Caldisericum exile AZM16c01]
MYEKDFIVDLTKKTGLIIKENFRKHLDVELKGPRDLVTNVDKYIDNFVRESILKAFPGYGVITEENKDLNELSSRKFIIDPLDGTTNFVKGYPQVAVSIALMEDSEITFGVVYNPILEELFIGELGKGATLNGEAIHVSKTSDFKDALIVTGFVYKERNENTYKSFERILSEALSVRCDGSAALDLAHVAMGIFDGYYQKGIHIWDIAAGSLIVKEAGGLVTTFKGNREFSFSGEILATNGLLHEKMVEFIKSV